LSQAAQPTVGDHLAQARQALEQGRYDEAVEHYTALVTAGKRVDQVLTDLDAFTLAHPDQRNIFALLGDAHAHKGNVDAALLAYDRAWEE
jgi:DNA-binding SARP family transcriptional activator